MSETLGTKQVDAEIQIHVTGISLAAPIGGKLQATASFRKALVDPDSGDVIQFLPWDSNTDGAPQVALDQITILGLVTLARFEVTRDSLHKKRKESIPVDVEEEQEDEETDDRESPTDEVVESK